MASSNSFSTASPTVVLPPTEPDQHFASTHYADSTMHGSTSNGFTTNGGQTSNGSSNPFTPAESYPPTLGCLAGRKRSRGDIHAPEEEEEELGDGSVETQMTEAPVKPRGKPIYGPGMTIIFPEDPGYAAAAESQSGTWIEESEARPQIKLSHMKRPSISTRKSQRVDTSASGADNLAQLLLPPQMREVTTEPLIDEATRTLGISWTRMDSSEVSQIVQAANSKWIQNHYPGLEDVSVWFENSAIPCYLVEAQNAYSSRSEYYIFSQDLQEARLVTSDPAQLVPRLKMLPALELAAPGGCIRAETDSMASVKPTIATQNTTTHNDFDTCRTSPTEEFFSMNSGMMARFCSAHEMDMD